MKISNAINTQRGAAVCAEAEKRPQLLIQEGGFGLSGGQRQTLLLAGYSSLNPISCCSMNPAPRWTNGGSAFNRTTETVDWPSHAVIATHRTAMLQLVDRIIVMDRGGL